LQFKFTSGKKDKPYRPHQKYIGSSAFVFVYRDVLLVTGIADTEFMEKADFTTPFVLGSLNIRVNATHHKQINRSRLRFYYMQGYAEHKWVLRFTHHRNDYSTPDGSNRYLSSDGLKS
jgi:hypothetical protein